MDTIIKEFHDLSSLIKNKKSFFIFNQPTLIIAITPRSGSTNFCSVLSSSNQIGEPLEIFNPRGVVQNLKKKLSVNSFNDYISSLTQDLDRFSFKTSWNDFVFFSECYKIVFPESKFVLLDRLDFYSQAVSSYKARKTGKWHSLKTTEDSNLESPQKIDYAMLEGILSNIFQGKKNWEDFFFNNNICALHLYYELVSHNWIKAGKQTLEYFNIHVDEETLTEGKYKKLPDYKSWQSLLGNTKKKLGLSWIDFK